MIEAGKTVSWVSQSQGSDKRKTGKVMAIIPRGKSAKELIPLDIKKSHIKFDVDISFDRERVLVAVPAGKDDQITHYYCPGRNILEMQGN